MTPYGVALALGFAAGIGAARRRAARAGLRSDAALEVSWVILASSLVGARSLWLATHPEHLARAGSGRLSALFDLQGLSMLGGVAVAGAVTAAYLWLRGLPALRYADLLAPSVALGEAIARVGCLLQGCCPGLPTELPWGVAAVAGSEAATRFAAAPLHPFAAYAALAALAVFAALVRVGRQGPPGRVCFGYLVLAGGARLALDPLRAYETAGIAQSNAGLALLLAGAGALGLSRLRSNLALR